MNRKLTHAIAFTFAVTGAGCLGGAPSSDPTANPAPVDPTASSSGNTGSTGDTGNLGIAPSSGDTSGGANNTFDHESDQIDPFEVLGRIQEQGPPEISTRLHSCEKVKYRTLGNLLTQLGVNLNATATPPSAGQLYKTGAQALGVANYGARVAEAIENTTAGATKLFDIFTRAATEVIAAMPNQAACKSAGAATQMFDAQGNCTLDGISCLQGAPASQAQVDLCNQALTQASTADIGKTIAVATILSAAHTCE
jgi:hypothetical protein